MNSFDPAQTLGPNDPLRSWLEDPAAADYIKQKALEQAQGVLGFSDPYGNNLDSVTGMPTAKVPVPEKEPNPNPVPAGQVPLPTAYPAVAPTGPSYVMDKGKPEGNPLDPVEAPAGVATPAQSGLPQARPEEAPAGASDVSAKAKEKSPKDVLTQALAGVKALQPPPVNAVGTPAAPHPNAIQAPQIQQLLQLLGAQSRPDPAATLGRLLVSGKA